MKITDHLGNEFNSVKEMCKAWNISMQTFYNRRKSGMNLKDIIETKSKVTNAIIGETCEFNGITYKSKKYACNKFGINYNTVYVRSKSMNETFNEAFHIILEKQLKEHKIAVDNKVYEELTEYFRKTSNDYVSIDYLCHLWDIDRKTYNYRKSLGWDLRHILEG